MTTTATQIYAHSVCERKSTARNVGKKGDKKQRKKSIKRQTEANPNYKTHSEILHTAVKYSNIREHEHERIRFFFRLLFRYSAIAHTHRAVNSTVKHIFVNCDATAVIRSNV